MYGELKMEENPSTTLSNSTEERNKVFNYIRKMLGDGMVDVELDADHLEIA